MDIEQNKVICVLNPDDIYYLNTYCGTSSEGLVSPYELQTLEQQGITFESKQEGSLLIKHPYKKEYIKPTEKSESDIILDRISHIETILSYLGGKHYKVLEQCQRALHLGRNINVKADAKVDKYEGGVGVKTSNQNNNSDSLSVSSETNWSGEYSEKGYKRAVEIAEECGLDKDSIMASILEQRNPKHPNPIGLKTYSIDVKSDLEELKKRAIDFKANIPTKINVNVDCDVSVDSTKSSQEHMTFDFEVEFGPVANKRAKTMIGWIVGGAVVVGVALAICFSVL